MNPRDILKLNEKKLSCKIVQLYNMASLKTSSATGIFPSSFPDRLDYTSYSYVIDRATFHTYKSMP